MTEQLPFPEFDHALSEAEKLRGEQLAEGHLNSWKAYADAWVANRVGEVFTAEDIQMAIGQPTDIDGRPSNNGVGGYMAGLRAKQVIVKVGWTVSTRVTNHGSDLRLWKIVRKP
jgi:hypothetical protein